MGVCTRLVDRRRNVVFDNFYLKRNLFTMPDPRAIAGMGRIEHLLSRRFSPGLRCSYRRERRGRQGNCKLSVRSVGAGRWCKLAVQAFGAGCWRVNGAALFRIGSDPRRLGRMLLPSLPPEETGAGPLALVNVRCSDWLLSYAVVTLPCRYLLS